MSDASRNPAGRRAAIRSVLAAEGTQSVGALAERVAVSLATIRRDLDVLEEQSAVERTFGGALARIDRPAEQAFAIREQQDVAAKRAVGHRAASLVQPGNTVLLNDGSTIMALARMLAAGGTEAFVVTPAVNVALTLAENRGITVCLLGGFVRPLSLATAGPFTLDMLGAINADLAFVSPDGFDSLQGAGFAHAEDAALARKMRSQAARLVLLATASKLARRGRVKGLASHEIDVLVTDEIDPRESDALSRQGVQILLAPRGEDGDDRAG